LARKHSSFSTSRISRELAKAQNTQPTLVWGGQQPTGGAPPTGVEWGADMERPLRDRAFVVGKVMDQGLSASVFTISIPVLRGDHRSTRFGGVSYLSFCSSLLFCLWGWGGGGGGGGENNPVNQCGREDVWLLVAL